MAKLGSKRIGDDFRNDDLAEALEYLRSKGWYDLGYAPSTKYLMESFKQNPYETNRAMLDRLVGKMLALGDAQAKLDYMNLRQWVRNRRRASVKSVSGETSFSCDLSQKAYANLVKLADRAGSSQRRVVENLLLEGDKTLKQEIKLLKDERGKQTEKFRKREGRVRQKEEELAREEQKIADFKRNAQPLVDLLCQVGKKGNTELIGAFRPILEALRSLGRNEDAQLTVRDAASDIKSGRFSEEERQLTHYLTVLMQAMRESDEEA
jgi:hypothetical protein